MLPGAKLVWAKDAVGEIGKAPTLPAGQFWCSADAYLEACR